MKSPMLLFHRAQMLRAFLALVNDPTKTDQVFAMADHSRASKGPLLRPTLDAIATQDGVKELFEKNYRPTIPPLAELAKFPEGTFGKAFADHMIKNGLEVDFFPRVEGQGLDQFMIERGRKNHDLWHVLSGFGTSVSDEIGLQGFTMGQMKNPFSALLIAGGILHSILRAPTIFSSTIDRLFEGYTMGRNAKPLLGIPIESMLERNLVDVRRELGIK